MNEVLVLVVPCVSACQGEIDCVLPHFGIERIDLLSFSPTLDFFAERTLCNARHEISEQCWLQREPAHT